MVAADWAGSTGGLKKAVSWVGMRIEGSTQRAMEYGRPQRWLSPVSDTDTRSVLSVLAGKLSGLGWGVELRSMGMEAAHVARADDSHVVRRAV